MQQTLLILPSAESDENTLGTVNETLLSFAYMSCPFHLQLKSGFVLPSYIKAKSVIFSIDVEPVGFKFPDP
jgi:hypothetical protein